MSHRLQIIDLDTNRVVVGNIIPGRGGRDGEVDLISRIVDQVGVPALTDRVCDTVRESGVGLLRSEAHVVNAVREAIAKADVAFAVRQAITRVFQESKDKV